MGIIKKHIPLIDGTTYVDRMSDSITSIYDDAKITKNEIDDIKKDIENKYKKINKLNKRNKWKNGGKK